MLKYCSLLIIIICCITLACEDLRKPSSLAPKSSSGISSQSKKNLKKRKDNPFLPQATGAIDEVLVIMADGLWKGTIGDTMRHFLQEDYAVLPQSQPIFDLRQINGGQFGSLLKRTATILVVGLLDSDDKASLMIKERLDQYKQKKQRDKLPIFFASMDTWAEPQNVVYLYGENYKALIDKLVKHNDKLIKQLYEVEDDKTARNVKIPGVDWGLTNFLQQDFKLNFEVPKNYKTALKNDTTLWIRHDDNATEAVSNIFIHKEIVAGGTESVDMKEWVIKFRDQLGKYVKSDVKGAYMYSDDILPFEFKWIKNEKGNRIIEARGLWRMKNDFLGGPFITYLVEDQKNSRFIVLDGFVYAPRSKKRLLMRRIEMLFRKTDLLE